MQAAYPAAGYPHYGQHQPFHYYVPPGYSNGYPANPYPASKEQYTAYYPDPNVLSSRHANRTYEFPSQSHSRPHRSQTQHYVSSVPSSSGPTTGSSPSAQMLMPQPEPFPTMKTPSSKTRALKSAMKKPSRSNSAPSGPPLRKRKESDSRQRLVPMTRTRTNSNSHFTPDHLFVSFHGSNELRLYNVAYQDTLDDLKERLLPMWPPGIQSQAIGAHSWRVIFSRNPWSTGGSDGIIVRRMICELFACLARQGYDYLTTTNNSSSSPYLVFRDAGPDDHADFFVAYFSRSGHRMTLIKPPRTIGEQIGPKLRASWPFKIATDRAAEDEVYTIELKRNSLGAPEFDKNVFAAHALQVIDSMGYKLDATVPLARSGMLGLGGRKEVWVFRGTYIRPRAESHGRDR